MLTTPQTCPHQQVLIVDRSSETREVLATALQRRGVQTMEARGARQGAVLARQHHPQVIVLDVEDDFSDDTAVYEPFEDERKTHDARLIILGRTKHFAQSLPNDRIVSKPYHYAPLIRTIELLLETSSQRTAHSARAS